MTGYAAEHRDSLAVLLSRVQRGVQSSAEAALLSTHVEHLLTEIGQAEATLARLGAWCDILDADMQRLTREPAAAHPVAANVRHILNSPKES